MKAIEILIKLFKEVKEHKICILVVLLSTIAGAFLGVTAFYNGWLS